MTSIDANAGSFAIREQSAYGQGSSFAGVAAGGSLSSMFWNPAVITQFNGKTKEQVINAILPHSSHSFTQSSLAPLGFGAPGSQGIAALVPAGYTSWQLNDKLWLGMSVNAPFGLGVRFPQVSAASPARASSANVQSYNFAPTVAYKFNDMVSVALGVQAQYMKASYDSLLSSTGPLVGALNGAGWGFGWTAGVTLTPLPKTTIGIGYRSAIDQKLNGTWDVPAAAAPATQPGSVHLTLPLPDTLTIGLRQGIGDRFTLLAGLEWARWSRIGTVPVLQGNGNPVTVFVNPPGVFAPLAFPFQYKDGWFYSLGGEYKLDPAWTVRAGIAYEKSPISDGVRTAAVPDNDRMWYSVGATYKPASLKGFTFDAGYSFIDVKNTPICVGLAAGCASNPWSSPTGAGYNGSVKSYVNIISVGVRYQWDDAAPVKTKLITR